MTRGLVYCYSCCWCKCSLSIVPQTKAQAWHCRGGRFRSSKQPSLRLPRCVRKSATSKKVVVPSEGRLSKEMIMNRKCGDHTQKTDNDPIPSKLVADKDYDKGILVVSLLVDPPVLPIKTKQGLPRVLFLTHLEEALLEKESEQVFQTMCRIMDGANSSFVTDGNKRSFDPLTPVVWFGNHDYGWGFNLGHFANIYAAKFGVPTDKMLEKMWGDWYFDATKKKWMRDDKGLLLERGICQFILSPIQQLCREAMNHSFHPPNQATTTTTHRRLDKMIQAAQIPADRRVIAKIQSGRSLLRYLLQQWLPLENEETLMTDSTSNNSTMLSVGTGDNEDDSATVSTAVSTEASSVASSIPTTRMLARRRIFRNWFSKQT